MAEEMITTGIGLPATPSLMNVTASGEGTAIGNVYGDIHLHLEESAVSAKLLQMIGVTQSISHTAEWLQSNTERFHLFVLKNEKYDCGCFSISKREALSRNILPEYSDRYRTLSPAYMQEMLNMPCLFTSLNPEFKEAPEIYPAIFGKLTEIIPQGDCIKFKFFSCGEFRQQFVNDHMALFNLIAKPVRNQLDEVHWTIRSGNLLAIANQIGVVIK